jgi:hypothetical protein
MPLLSWLGRVLNIHRAVPNSVTAVKGKRVTFREIVRKCIATDAFTMERIRLFLKQARECNCTDLIQEAAAQKDNNITLTQPLIQLFSS